MSICITGIKHNKTKGFIYIKDIKRLELKLKLHSSLKSSYFS